MFRYLFLCLGALLITPAFGACPTADQLARTESLSKAVPVYTRCALNENDDDSQIYLAKIYQKGQGDVEKNLFRSLLFYHLSSENGNASAMVGLSQLLTELDNSEVGRLTVLKYVFLMQYSMKHYNQTSFQGELLHPYALLTLAAEGPESKWFYVSSTKSDPSAARLMKAYQIEPEVKQKVLKQATAWKQRKMLDMARDVLTIPEYNRFYDTVYPKSGIKDSFARTQAMNQLKEKVEQKQK